MIPQGWNRLVHFVNKLLVNFSSIRQKNDQSMLPFSKYLCQMSLVCHLGVLFLSGSHVGIFMNLPYFIWSKKLYIFWIKRTFMQRKYFLFWRVSTNLTFYIIAVFIGVERKPDLFLSGMTFINQCVYSARPDIRYSA
mgnify:CR=1 FL=1